jgi:hypothetical protein
MRARSGAYCARKSSSGTCIDAVKSNSRVSVPSAIGAYCSNRLKAVGVRPRRWRGATLPTRSPRNRRRQAGLPMASGRLRAGNAPPKDGLVGALKRRRAGYSGRLSEAKRLSKKPHEIRCYGDFTGSGIASSSYLGASRYTGVTSSIRESPLCQMCRPWRSVSWSASPRI